MIVGAVTVHQRDIQSVKLLLWSLYDVDHQPPTATGQITRKAGARRVAESDTAPTFSTRCDRCGGSGDGKARFERGRRTTLCELCGGTGRRVWSKTEPPRTPDDADLILDAVTRHVSKRRDGALLVYARLEKHLAGLVKHVNKPPEFSLLRGREYEAQRLLVGTYVPDHAAYAEARLDPFTAAEARLSDEDRRLVDVALAYLAYELLRDLGSIPVPADVREAERSREKWLDAVKNTRGPAKQARDRELKRLHREQGWQVPALARRAGLSERQVQEILFGRSSAA